MAPQAISEKSKAPGQRQEKLESSKRDAPPQGVGLKDHIGSSHPGRWCGNPRSLFPLLAGTMQTHGPPVEGGATHQAKAVMSRAKKGGGGLGKGGKEEGRHARVPAHSQA